MHRKIFSAVFILNTLLQALITLLFPIGATLLFSYLAVTHLSFSPITYAIAVPLGAIFGIYSMIRFILSAMRAIEAIERGQKRGNKDEEK